MVIDAKTLYADFFAIEDVLTDESQKALQEAVDKAFVSYYDLTIKNLFECLRGDFSVIGVIKGREADITALQGVWMRGFTKWCDKFIKLIETYTPPATMEAKKAQEFCVKQKFEESVLVFMREYFALHSFSAVYDLQVSDYILAKRDSYNKAVFEQAFARITAQKFKSK